MFATLHNMMMQLKSNAVSIPYTIDGVYEYIYSILSPVTYADLATMTPFIVPVPPGPLSAANNTTQYQIVHTTVLYKTATHTFRMYQLVQRALIQQVLEALKAKILTRLRSRVTGQVPADIQTLLLHLFQV